MSERGFEILGDAEARKRYDELQEELSENFKFAAHDILVNITESDLAKYMNMISEAILARMMEQRKLSLLEGLSNGELQEFSHSLVLAVIGGLVMEGIL